MVSLVLIFIMLITGTPQVSAFNDSRQNNKQLTLQPECSTCFSVCCLTSCGLGTAGTENDLLELLYKKLKKNKDFIEESRHVNGKHITFRITQKREQVKAYLRKRNLRLEPACCAQGFPVIRRLSESCISSSLLPLLMIICGGSAHTLCTMSDPAGIVYNEATTKGSVLGAVCCAPIVGKTISNCLCNCIEAGTYTLVKDTEEHDSAKSSKNSQLNRAYFPWDCAKCMKELSKGPATALCFPLVIAATAFIPGLNTVFEYPATFLDCDKDSAILSYGLELFCAADFLGGASVDGGDYMCKSGFCKSNSDISDLDHVR